jgi:16S rRNA (guanine966-N2)-methyltransferase
MRITSGRAGGRTVKAPKGLRPTQDRVREAYFSKVASHIAGCRFLDLFSGSGAVGIEAWSRGAEAALLVERDRSSVKIAQKNAEELSAENIDCVCARVEQFLARGASRSFDLIYADPPYALAEEAGFASELLRLVEKGGWLAESGILALERRSGPDAEPCEGWELLDSKKYGESALDYYFRH